MFQYVPYRIILLLCQRLRLRKLSMYMIFPVLFLVIIPFGTFVPMKRTTSQVAHAETGKLEEAFLQEQYHKSRTLVQEQTILKLSRNRVFSLQSAGQNGPYVILQHFLPAGRKFAWHAAVTLCTHATINYLNNLISLSDRWDGPISVAVFAPREMVALTIKGIYILNGCNHQIRDKVTFHVYYIRQTLNETISVNFTSLERESRLHKCDEMRSVVTDFNNRMDTQLTNDSRLWYPVNVGRNIARINAHTHYVLPLDIEFLPSAGFNDKFFRMLKQKKFLHLAARLSAREWVTPKVFVLPEFEVLPTVERPTNKSQLQQLINNKKAQYFHRYTCGVCHKMPYYNLWLAKLEDGNLDIFYVTRWIPPLWEPVYVGTNDEPLYDERFKGYGSNKIQQVYEMCRADYKFFILDEAFVMHSGITISWKKTRARHIMLKSNMKLLNKFASEINSKYEKTKRKPYCRFTPQKNETLGYFPTDVLG